VTVISEFRQNRHNPRGDSNETLILVLGIKTRQMYVAYSNEIEFRSLCDRAEILVDDCGNSNTLTHGFMIAGRVFGDMSKPQLVASALGDDEVLVHESIGGDDSVTVTPARTILYRADGLLSDESVTKYSHRAERVEVSEGRRKATVRFSYGIEDDKKMKIPSKLASSIIPSIFEGILRTSGVLDSAEILQEVFRFSELSIVITNQRLLRHIGSALWSPEFEQYYYQDIIDLEFETGSVARTVVLTLDGHRERFKTPKDESRHLKKALTSAMLSEWGVESVAERREQFEQETSEDESAAKAFEHGPDLSTESHTDSASVDIVDEASSSTEQQQERTQTGPESIQELLDSPANDDRKPFDTETDSSTQADRDRLTSAESEGPSVSNQTIVDRISTIEDKIEQQTERLDRQEELIRQLIEELKRGR